ncbi:MAG: penicillin acylase family protein [Burkholderiaceae bacterium]
MLTLIFSDFQRAVTRRSRSLVVVMSVALASIPQLAVAYDRSSYSIPGLSGTVEILRDQWGISHIYAKSQDDLFFAQGFNAARDRLWELDQWRRQGEGLLSEQFGARFAAQDRASRLFLYRGDLDAEFASYHPQGRQILTAYTNGINAYIDQTRSNADLLPPEFKLTGTVPGYWKPTTPLIRLFGLTRNLSSEVNNSRKVAAMGAAAVERLTLFEPPATLTVPPGIDLSQIGTQVLTNYNLAHSGVTFQPSDIRGALSLAVDRGRIALALNTERPTSDDLKFESNNWTVAPSRTATGRPLLSNDPHRAVSVPSLRYMVHLHAPGWNVIGAGEPTLPGVSIGHNDRIAFGLTIFEFADEEDLYVYDTNPADPTQYRYNGAWENMRVVNESIPVRDAAPVAAELRFTRHGPVIWEDTANHKAYAVRAAYLEFPGTAAYLASLRIDQATNWSEFTAAMERHYTPSENMVYADVDGNIGWFGGSIQPLRANWNGQLPVPGDGSYEWNGFLATSQLPRILNPAKGYYATANEFNIPATYQYLSISDPGDWADPSRVLRINEVLDANVRVTLQDSMRLQYDELSRPARELVPLLTNLSSSDPRIASALRMLTTWDFVTSADSVATTIYELWQPLVISRVSDLYVPPAARSVFGNINRRLVLRFLNAPDGTFGTDPVAGRNALLLAALGDAVVQATTLLGADMNAWQWGTLHHMQFVHALSPALPPETAQLFNTARVPIGGDGNTVHATSYRTSDFRQVGGASYRQVIDVGAWDNSVTLNAPGQSGDPRSPHYRDLLPLWANGTFIPMAFSPEKVKSVTESILILKPIPR